jgi:hypothetical protein
VPFWFVIETDRVGFYNIAALLEIGYLGVSSGRILDAPGIDFIFLIVENDDAGFEFNILVIEFGLIVKRDQFGLLVEFGVFFCLIANLAFKYGLFFAFTVSSLMVSAI